jgi:hypothetical protein
MEPRPTWQSRKTGARRLGPQWDKKYGKNARTRGGKEVRHRLGHFTGANPRQPKIRLVSGLRGISIIRSLNIQEKTEVHHETHTLSQRTRNGWVHWIVHWKEDKRSGWAGLFHPLSILILGSRPRRGTAPAEEGSRPRTRRQTGEEGKEMASSSGSKPSTEERLKSVEEELKRLKQFLQNQDDFLQNLDIEAGRRLEMLEADITSTKIGFSEELEQIRNEVKDPQKEFEERVSKLEVQMEKLNKDWHLERDLPKNEGPRKFGQ